MRTLKTLLILAMLGAVIAAAASCVQNFTASLAARKTAEYYTGAR